LELIAVPDLSLDQKVVVLSGRSFQETAGLETFGIGSLKVIDGPFGARGADYSLSSPAAHFPCGPALGATFDPALLREVGAAIGAEIRLKGGDVLAGPNLNLHRTPLAGRNFECYSEDPYLTARIGVAYIQGAQSVGVAACAKHFVANDAEYRRHSVSCKVSERALRELYLVPFEAAVIEGGVWSIMAAYNGINGTLCSEHHELLTTILRDEWGFDGWCVSDWYGVQSTVASANAGVDSEMPGPVHWGAKLADAVVAGDVDEKVIDAKVENTIRIGVRVGRTDPSGAPVSSEHPAETPSDPDVFRDVARRAAAAAIVLLKNDGDLLPLRDDLARLAVIGPNANVARTQGSGSAHVRRHHCVTPLDAIRAALPSCDVTFERGRDNERETPIVEADVTIEFFAEDSHEVLAVEHVEEAHVVWNGQTPGGLTGQPFRARLSWSFTADRAGAYTFSLGTAGEATLKVDGSVVVTSTSTLAPDQSLFARDREQFTGTVELAAGAQHEVVVDYVSGRHRNLRSVIAGMRPPEDPGAFDRAVAAAAGADAAVVVVGTNMDWETEGFDRESFDLPGRQAELVRAVAAVNPRTVAVVVAGTAVDCEWSTDTPAALYAWFGGQEAGPALADVLFGRAEPAGRLPITIPRAIADAPSSPWWPPTGDTIEYGEDLLVGYRGHDASGVAPRFAFGHGGSYTTFAWGEPRRSGAAVEVDVTNTGTRHGSEVVLLFAGRSGDDATLPPKELKGFAKLDLAPGERATARLPVDARTFAHWDHDTRAWVETQGPQFVLLAASATDLRARLSID
jgi:beta-glucosidase